MLSLRVITDTARSVVERRKRENKINGLWEAREQATTDNTEAFLNMSGSFPVSPSKLRISTEIPDKKEDA